MEVKVESAKLDHGMYVARLDRPWLETSFLIQGFYIRNDRDLEQLRDCCAYVYIDTEAHKNDGVVVERRRGSDRRRGDDRRQGSAMGLPKAASKYEDQSEITEEIEIATVLRQEISDAVEEICESVQHGKQLDLDSAKTAVKNMTESILRNPDAFSWLRLLKDKDDYTYAHCMDSSALSIAFGRTLGLSRRQLDDLAMGALMSDVGKMKLAAEILNKPGRLTEQEFSLMQQHVAHSVRIMGEAGGFSKASIEIAACHHERIDGTGYPRGLKGAEIPLLARMVAIVDTYDAITSETVYRKAISAHEAVRRLYEWRESSFQAELVEQFIQTLGTYPTGSVVELTTGQVGIVVAQNRVRRLRPKVMLVLDADKQRYDAAPVLDLIQETEDEHGEDLEIFKVLDPAAYGIDPAEFFL